MHRLFALIGVLSFTAGLCAVAFWACSGTEQFKDGQVGNTCKLTADCGAQTADGRTVQLNCYTNERLFPNGYCSQRCTPGATVEEDPELACPSGSTCIAPREYDEDREDGYCLKNCQTDEDCVRGGGESVYVCMRDRGGRRVCVNGMEGLFGETCDGMYQCQADLVCFTGDRFPFGYCTRSCDSDSECPYHRNKQGLCIRGYCHIQCGSDSDCRQNNGYACLDIGGGRTFCGNAETEIVDPLADDDATPPADDDATTDDDVTVDDDTTTTDDDTTSDDDVTTDDDVTADDDATGP